MGPADAVAEVGDWVARGLVGPDFVLSVNVSARQLADPAFPAQVATALAGWGRPADRLWLEITETAVMADPALSETGLEDLHALGVRLALDDFGSGYSSLGKLARTPADLDPQARPLLRGGDGRPARPRDRRGRGRAGRMRSSCRRSPRAWSRRSRR